MRAFSFFGSNLGDVVCKVYDVKILHVLGQCYLTSMLVYMISRNLLFGVYFMV